MLISFSKLRKMFIVTSLNRFSIILVCILIPSSTLGIQDFISCVPEFLQIVIILAYCFVIYHLSFSFSLIFQDRVFMSSSEYSGTCSVDQAGLELRDLPVTPPECWD